MLVVVDDLVLYILLLLALGLGGGFGLLFMLLTRSPYQARTIISAWLFHKVLTIEATMDRGLAFVARTRKAEGALEAKIGGQKSIKVIAKTDNPILQAPCHLDKSGVKAYLTFEPSTIAVNSAMAAAMTMLKAQKIEDVPEDWRAMGRNLKVGDKKLIETYNKSMVGADGKPQEVKSDKLNLVELGLIPQFFPNAWTENQFRNYVESAILDDRTGRGKSNMKYLLIGIILVVVAVVVIVIVTGGLGGTSSGVKK